MGRGGEKNGRRGGNPKMVTICLRHVTKVTLTLPYVSQGEKTLLQLISFCKVYWLL